MFVSQSRSDAANSSFNLFIPSTSFFWNNSLKPNCTPLISFCNLINAGFNKVLILSKTPETASLKLSKLETALITVPITSLNNLDNTSNVVAKKSATF